MSGKSRSSSVISLRIEPSEQIKLGKYPSDCGDLEIVECGYVCGNKRKLDQEKYEEAIEVTENEFIR